MEQNASLLKKRNFDRDEMRVLQETYEQLTIGSHPAVVKKAYEMLLSFETYLSKPEKEFVIPELSELERKKLKENVARTYFFAQMTGIFGLLTLESYRLVKPISSGCDKKILYGVAALTTGLSASYTAYLMLKNRLIRNRPKYEFIQNLRKTRAALAAFKEEWKDIYINRRVPASDQSTSA